MKKSSLAILLLSVVILSSVVVYSADAAGIPKKAISTVARFLKADLPTTTVFSDQANTYTAGQKQTFQADGTNAGLNFAGVASDPSGVAAGDVWRNTASDALKVRGSSVTQTIPTLESTETFTGTTTLNSLTLGGAANANNQRITSLGTPTSVTDAARANTLQTKALATGTCSNGQYLAYQTSNSTWICTTLSALTSLNGDSTVAQTVAGTSGNITVTDAGATHTINLGSNAVVTSGSAQTVTKAMTFANGATINGTSNTIVSKTGAYSLTTTDDTVLANANGGAFTLTLPSPSSKMGKVLTIKKTDTTSNKVTISGLIDGSSSVGISTPNKALRLQSDGSIWRTIGGNNTVPYAYMYNNTASMPTVAGNFKIAFNAEGAKSGISHTASGSAGTGGGGDITILESGVYYLSTTGTFSDATSATSTCSLYFQVNGVDVPYSAATLSIPNTKIGANIVSTMVLYLNAGDTLNVWYQTGSANFKLISGTVSGSTTNYPAVALTMYKVGG